MTTETPLPAANQTPPVDLRLLMDWVDGESERLTGLVELFWRTTERDLGLIAQAIKTGQATEVHRLAHGCASASGTCGMNAIVAPLRELESQASRNDLSRGTELLAETRLQFQLIMQHLEAIRRGGRP